MTFRRGAIAALAVSTLVACYGSEDATGLQKGSIQEGELLDEASEDSLATAAVATGCVDTSAATRFLAYVLSEYDNEINVVDTKKNEVIFTVTIPGKIARPHRGWVHPSQRRLYVSNKTGGYLLAFDISDPKKAPKLVNEVNLGLADLHNVQITEASNCAVDGLVWVSYAGGSGDPSFVGVYQAADLSLVTKIFTGVTKAHGMLLRPNSNELWVTNRPASPHGNVMRIDTVTKQTITTPITNLPTLAEFEDEPNNIAFTDDGALAYVVNQGDDHNLNVPTEVTIIDANAFSVVQQLPLDPALGRRPHALQFDADNRWMWVCTRLGGAVAIIDTESVPLPRIVTYVPVGTECHDVALTPDGRFAYTSTMGGPGIGAMEGKPWYEDNVKVIDTNTLQVIKAIPIPSHAIVFRSL
jgi:DNA-binding beta-propeller fold protein YncE